MGATESYSRLSGSARWRRPIPRCLVTLGVAVIRAFEIAKGNNEAGLGSMEPSTRDKVNYNSYYNYEYKFSVLEGGL
jgi:hypothetical protein